MRSTCGQVALWMPRTLDLHFLCLQTLHYGFHRLGLLLSRKRMLLAVFHQGSLASEIFGRVVHLVPLRCAAVEPHVAPILVAEAFTLKVIEFKLWRGKSKT